MKKRLAQPVPHSSARPLGQANAGRAKIGRAKIGRAKIGRVQIRRKIARKAVLKKVARAQPDPAQPLPAPPASTTIHPLAPEPPGSNFAAPGSLVLRPAVLAEPLAAPGLDLAAAGSSEARDRFPPAGPAPRTPVSSLLAAQQAWPRAPARQTHFVLAISGNPPQDDSWPSGNYSQV